MSEMQLHTSPSSEDTSVLAHVPGTRAWEERRSDLQTDRRRRRELQEAVHQTGLERIRLASEIALGDSSVRGAALVARTTVEAAAVLGNDADAAYRVASPVGQNLILDATAAVAAELNRVGASHVAAFRR